MQYYRSEFKKYPRKLQLEFLDQARIELKKKFSGKKTIENKVSALPPDSPFIYKKWQSNVLSKTQKKNINCCTSLF